MHKPVKALNCLSMPRFHTRKKYVFYTCILSMAMIVFYCCLSDVFSTKSVFSPRGKKSSNGILQAVLKTDLNENTANPNYLIVHRRTKTKWADHSQIREYANSSARKTKSVWTNGHQSMHFNENITTQKKSRGKYPSFIYEHVGGYIGNASSMKPTDSQICVANNHVMFLKTHKTASTTIANILHRYAYSSHLTVMLPIKGLKTWTPACKNKEDFVMLKNFTFIGKVSESEKYDIFARHWIYDSTFIEDNMHKDTFRFTILREPFFRFRSSFHYFGFADKFKYTKYRDPMYAFLLDLSHPQHQKRILLMQKKLNIRYIPNRMMYDLGFYNSDYNRTGDAFEYIKRIDKEFDLVITTEYFNAGMVLLRRRLCWDLKSILYLKLNVHKKPYHHYNAASVELVKKRSNLDYMLYDYFHAKLKALLDNQSRDFYDEVRYYELIQGRVAVFCKSKTQDAIKVSPNKWTKGFEINRETCAMMKMKTKHFASLLTERYYARLTKQLLDN
ncbi:uncharacterized protein LOC106153833 [Lingula anatina]|uniref:Uncharacterized protein LOC106153833 n=1 Tax=Lingula anatina TaxID=7574 RepID=A0A1S3HBJ7_LINAN|nr:uncharacterized protein LOC106153833 [Lingula anatina]|eukprot:XP_013383395.1 uncharacterized protein LOC106153833 [Lingula anatina]